MRKYVALATAVVLNFSAVLPVVAAGGGEVDLCPEGFEGICGLSIGGVITGGIQLVLALALILAFVFLVYGGIKWIMSGGDKAGTEAAKGTITAALIGLVVVFLSWALLNLVKGFFGSGTGDVLDLGSIKAK
jgi:hypothetical protein